LGKIVNISERVRHSVSQQLGGSLGFGNLKVLVFYFYGEFNVSVVNQYRKLVKNIQMLVIYSFSDFLMLFE
jgi:Mn-containing catalase